MWLRENLSEPDRFRALKGMTLGPSRSEIEARLPQVRTPSLVLMGTQDRDFKDPGAEARRVRRAHRLVRHGFATSCLWLAETA
jgi:hypothetical protein